MVQSVDISIVAKLHVLVFLRTIITTTDLACLPTQHPAQVSNLVEDAQAGKALKGPNSSNATTPLSPTTAHAIFAATVRAWTTGSHSFLQWAMYDVCQHPDATDDWRQCLFVEAAAVQ